MEKENNNQQKTKIVARFIKRSKTNDNELAKQYFRVLTSKGRSSAISVRKYVLVSNDFDMYEQFGFKLLKEFKGRRLYMQIFSIKIETLGEVVDWLDSFSSK